MAYYISIFKYDWYDSKPCSIHMLLLIRDILILGNYRNLVRSIVLYMFPYVENPRCEIFHGISKILNSCRKKLSRNFARYGTQHKGKRKSPENGDHRVHH